MAISRFCCFCIDALKRHAFVVWPVIRKQQHHRWNAVLFLKDVKIFSARPASLPNFLKLASLERNDTFQASLWGLCTIHWSPPLTGSTSTQGNEDCKKDCGLDLQSQVKKGLQVRMQSILALGLRIWIAIPSKRSLMMPVNQTLCRG